MAREYGVNMELQLLFCGRSLAIHPHLPVPCEVHVTCGCVVSTHTHTHAHTEWERTNSLTYSRIWCTCASFFCFCCLAYSLASLLNRTEYSATPHTYRTQHTAHRTPHTPHTTHANSKPKLKRGKGGTTNEVPREAHTHQLGSNCRTRS